MVVSSTIPVRSISKPARVDYREGTSSLDPHRSQAASRAPVSGNSLIALTNIRMMHLLERVVARFNEAGIPVMALKGAALNLVLYDQPDERSMVDLDLMVKQEHLTIATALLEELGCLRNQILMREDFFPRFYYEIEYRSGDIDPVIIDLHVRPFRSLRYARIIPVDALWGRAQPMPIGEATVLIPCAEDMLIHLATHAAIHGNSKLKWLKDIKQWVDTRQDQMDWDYLIHTATKWRLTLPVLRGIEATEAQFGQACPPQIIQWLVRTRVNWRDRLTLRQAPRDNDHPVAHVLVNAICTPGWRFVLAYLQAAIFPNRNHMAEWYCQRHKAWLPCAHLLRYLWPIVGRSQRIWSRFTKIEVRKSSTHGNGVFATRDISVGEVIAHYRLKPVDRDGTYVVSHTTRPNGTIQYYAITGKLRFLNHYCKANAELSSLKLIALRPIRCGQEITMDYGINACNCRRNRESNPDPVTEKNIG